MRRYDKRFDSIQLVFQKEEKESQATANTLANCLVLALGHPYHAYIEKVANGRTHNRQIVANVLDIPLPENTKTG